jgi:hypothetical protein
VSLERANASATNNRTTAAFTRLGPARSGLAPQLCTGGRSSATDRRASSSPFPGTGTSSTDIDERRLNNWAVPGICEPSHCADLSISTVGRAVLGERNGGDDGRVDAPADTLEAQVPTPGPSQAGKTHGVWLPSSATVIDPECRQRKLLLSTVFGWAVCLAACRDGFAGPGLRAGPRRMVRPVLGSADHATSGPGSAVWHVRLGRSAEAVQPSLGDPYSVTRAAAWPTSQTVNAHLHRLPM